MPVRLAPPSAPPRGFAPPSVLTTLAALVAVALLALSARPAAAQDGGAPGGPSVCATPGVAEAPGVVFRRVRYDGPFAPGEVAITYMGHSTFLIQTPEGLEIATDFADWLPPGFAPELVTMNGAHESHFTDNPPAEIALVLRGWSDASGPAVHDVMRRDARVRNVTTDVVRGPTLVYPDANSIFVFEIGDLCLAHLGHLHVAPTEAQYAAIGQIDIVFAPVEGGAYMLDATAMIDVVDRLGARVVIPMHFFSLSAIDRFERVLGARYVSMRPSSPTVLFSPETLPAQPTLLILPPIR